MSVHNHPPYCPPCSERPAGECMVVIDPADREQIERFAVAYTEVAIRRTGRGTAWAQRDDDSRDKVIADLQAALREFANPPPPKPTIDGALVECDYDGKRGRAVLLGGSWTFYGESLRDHGAIYEDFENVRVLSEGVIA